MESKVPIPTDNIYKFYALFGLTLLITSIAAFLYVHKTTNELIFEAAIAVEELASKDKLTPAEAKRKEVLEKRVAIAKSDESFFNEVLALLAAGALVLMFSGFRHWQCVIQPKQDRLLDLQIEKAEQDIKPPPRSPLRAPQTKR